jgi:hypothetical protein
MNQQRDESVRMGARGTALWWRAAEGRGEPGRAGSARAGSADCAHASCVPLSGAVHRGTAARGAWAPVATATEMAQCWDGRGMQLGEDQKSKLWYC